MKVTRHGDDLWKLTRLGVINCYFVREDDGLTLIDTGMSGTAPDILKAAQQIGLPITRMTLTHAHMDHLGSLDEVWHEIPHAEVAFTQRTADFVAGNWYLMPEEPQNSIGLKLAPHQTKPTRLLAVGDKFGSLRVVASPGHSPDHSAFLDERDGTLIAGDAFQTQGGMAVSGIYRWAFPLPAMSSWHLPTALESAVALRALNPMRLAVGHGAILENPNTAMDHAIAEAEKKVHG